MLGNLDQFSAFPFESYLHQLKRLVRSGRNPIVQIVKRLNEMMNIPNANKPREGKLATRRPNNSYILTNSTCCEVIDSTGLVDDNQRQKYMCRVYERITPLFVNPSNSVIIGAFKVQARHSDMKILSEEKLDRKAIFVETEYGQGIFLAILHDFKL